MTLSSLPRRALSRPHSLFKLGNVRHASTSDVAQAVKEKSSTATSQAALGLSRVTSTAGSVLGRVGMSAGGFIGGLGGRAERLVGAVQSLVPPTIYYTRVVRELAKIVYETRQMSLPPPNVFQAYFQQISNGLRHPKALLQSGSSAAESQSASMLNHVRNMSRQQWLSTGVVAAEVLGFFTVGEMLGRMKIVGYRSELHDADHH